MKDKFKILVCAKGVPENEIFISHDALLNWNYSDYRINRFDECVVEEAVLIKEKLPGTEVDIITVGPPECSVVLRRGMGMGVDRAIHIQVNQQEYLSPFVCASWIAEYARAQNYDLILTGMMSEDQMQGVVGQMLAEYLSLPCTTAVIRERISPDNNSVLVEREIEGGLKYSLEMYLPAVLCLLTGINVPRYPSLSKMLRANKTPITLIESANLNQPAPRQRLVRQIVPRKMRSGTKITGSQQEKARQLLRILQDKRMLD